MLTRQSIIDAYGFLRKNNCTIPDYTLEFMRDASLSLFDQLYDEGCKSCQHNGGQAIYPSGCTGCGSFNERNNWKPKVKAVV